MLNRTGDPAVNSLRAANKNKIIIDKEKIRTGAEIFINFVKGIFPSTITMKAVRKIKDKGVHISFIIQSKMKTGIGAIILLRGLSRFKKELWS